MVTGPDARKLVVGNTLEPCTKTIESVQCVHPNKVESTKITFVDTPALEGPETLQDFENQLKAWMKKR